MHIFRKCVAHNFCYSIVWICKDVDLGYKNYIWFLRVRITWVCMTTEDFVKELHESINQNPELKELLDLLEQLANEQPVVRKVFLTSNL